ncbi:Primary amine oxidase precursor [Leclercia adecarboxylata]|uniref:Primary amine oxidase n=1 Tax=Leclercia adecarboxylata TaxID=83655 RepID=A0A4V6JJI3_9ENTR|nr:Primary amine oxidase precursor [Leclercia adecarboxylata]
MDGTNNSLVAMDPEVKPNTAGGPRTSTLQINQYNIDSEQQAAQKFDPGTIRLLSNHQQREPHGQPGLPTRSSLMQAVRTRWRPAPNLPRMSGSIIA